MSEDWIDSLDRAVEVAEGQIALARALDAKAIGMTIEVAERLLRGIAELRPVAEAALRWRTGSGGQDLSRDLLWERCNELLAVRGENGGGNT